jgi:rare lipoprotein A
MSWINDAHVARGLLGALSAIGTALVLVITSQPPAPSAPGPTPQATVETFAFKPLEGPAMMAAAVPSGQFEEPWTPIVPRPAPTPDPAPVIAQPEPEPVIALPEPEPELAIASAPNEVLFEIGIASTYGVGDGFQGNRTACGQIFNTHVVQVAHKTLKCGTMIRIEDAETGKSVVAEVTDRGPYIRGRIVDLSWAAFRELDPAGGLRPVKVYLRD